MSHSLYHLQSLFMMVHVLLHLHICTGLSNGENLIPCLMRCMAMELYHTKGSSTSLEESLKAGKCTTGFKSPHFYDNVGRKKKKNHY